MDTALPVERPSVKNSTSIANQSFPTFIVALEISMVWKTRFFALLTPAENSDCTSPQRCYTYLRIQILLGYQNAKSTGPSERDDRPSSSKPHTRQNRRTLLDSQRNQCYHAPHGCTANLFGVANRPSLETRSSNHEGKSRQNHRVDVTCYCFDESWQTQNHREMAHQVRNDSLGVKLI